MAEPAKVAVVGEGTVSAVPDQCTVHAALTVVADNVADAVSRVGILASRAVSSLKAAGLDPDDVRTTNLAVHDFFDKGEQKVTGRVASYQLEITVRKLDQLSEHLARLVTAAGDSLQIHSLGLGIAHPEPLMREARVKAMDDASAKATQLAQSAGGRLGRLVSIDEGQSVAGPVYRGGARLMAASGGGAAAHLQVETGSLNVTCRVEVAYEVIDEKKSN